MHVAVSYLEDCEGNPPYKAVHLILKRVKVQDKVEQWRGCEC